jgi:hypothetical protein
MRFPNIAALALAVSAADAEYINQAPSQCPPPGFQALQPFNLKAYVAGRWFVQAQMPVSYLDEKSNYCVTAMYKISPKRQVSSAKILQPLLNWFRYTPDEIDGTRNWFWISTHGSS